MAESGRTKRDVQKVADIICAAGGEIVGRTRLQKISYLLELAGVGDGFPFEYKHYGPFSEELAVAARSGHLLNVITEEERATSWGGTYSIFRVAAPPIQHSDARMALAQLGARADSIELELAATAAFLAAEGEAHAWAETARRKPEKADAGRLERAKKLYERMRAIETPRRLPAVAD